MSDPATRSAALHDAITAVLREHAEEGYDQGITTDWVLVVEQLDAVGDPYLRMISAPDSLPWRRLGMLSYCISSQNATITADHLTD